MKLIIDSGSTKAKWTAIDSVKIISEFETEGYNPCMVDAEYISQSLIPALPAEIEPDEVEAVYFYGAGCYPDNAWVIVDAMKKVFPSCLCSTGSDLLAASRALLGNEPGFVSILGTGTNTGIYDGKKIINNVDSLGYFLGDEGSGYAIGKQLLVSYTRNNLPSTLRDLFFKKYNLSIYEVIENIYSKPHPNRYCASFSVFVSEHIQHPYFYKIVKDCFQEFFNNLVLKYENYAAYTFNCVGSIGFNFKEILTEVAKTNGMRIGTIISAPQKKLVCFHLKCPIIELR